MRRLDLIRHAKRDPNEDRLSAAGRAQAEDVGREASDGYDAVFVSPAARAAETAAWILRGTGRQLASHGVIDGSSPKGVEDADDKKWRKDFLRQIGYKL